ncbi:DUF4405 domain-containing protein [Candidatus Woesearchaeota archaeon]|nr:DUF4405 domain-containing protein [Candidatus Woesearchaeota archaeon]
MEKNTINYIVDMLLAVSFLSVALTGLIKFKQIFRLTGIGYEGLPIYEISVIHDWSGLVMALLVVVHIALNWSWIVCTTKDLFLRKKDKKKCR